jgi:sugar lactone lactonase YvrE
LRSDRPLAPRTLAEGLCNVEGPVVGPAGWVLNVCSLSRPTEDWPTRGGDVTATHRDRPLETRVLFNTSTDAIEGIPASLAFGPDGCLYVTDEGRRAILRVDAQGGESEFISHWSGDRLLGPNDLSFDGDGNLFFTDPWTSSPANPVGGVYGYDWASGSLHQIDIGLEFPNGIVAREGRLYVAETFPCQVWTYEIVGAGRADGKRRFCSLPRLAIDTIHGPDGMAFDAEGNLYVAHYGGGAVYVYEPKGKLVERIATPGENPTNVCFGGPEHDQLFVTVDDPGTLVVYDIGVRGDVLSFCPSRVPDHPWAAMLSDPQAGAGSGSVAKPSR